jgi:GTP-binding protein
VITDAATGEVVTEVLKHGDQVTLLRGGRGGLGNTVFKSSVNQAPRQTKAGTPGQEGRYQLTVKTIADVGLIGYPNAGKSSLLDALTKAAPKVGHYAFTTLHPKVGILADADTYARISIADIPGLIEGASENRGLGHRFLRHIERCRLLLFVLDMAGTEGRSPSDDFKQLMLELSNYDPELLKRPRLLVANKTDEPSFAEHLEAFIQKYPSQPQPIPVCCLDESGLDVLKQALFEAVDSLDGN